MLKNDRRSNLRSKKVLPIVLHLRDQKTKKSFQFKGEAVDISKNGLSISTDNLLPPVDKGLVEIHLPEPFQFVKVRMRIIWRNDEKQFYGIEFVNSLENKLGDWEKFIESSDYFIQDRRNKNQSRRIIKESTGQQSEKDKRNKSRRISDLNKKEIFEEDSRSSISRGDLLPKQKDSDYTVEAARFKREWLSAKTGAELKHIGVFSENPKNMQGNIENFIGVAQVPIGVAGPLKINGQFAKGKFYIPMATTEGALIYSYQQAMQVISLAGGANTTLLKDEIHISPYFEFRSISITKQFVEWLETNFTLIKKAAERVTRYGKLVRLEPHIFNRAVVVKFCYTTGDAMGINMITFATEEACKFIVPAVKPNKFYLQSNFSSIKKVTSHNFIMGCGKMMVAEAVIPWSLVRRSYHISPEEIVAYSHVAKEATLHAGMVGISGHAANALAAIFIACGQDAASVVDSYVCLTHFDLTENRSLYISIKLPSLLVGTVGGGTDLATQRECLKLLGCYGEGQSKKFSEIVAASVLAGELGLVARLASGAFARGHRKYGKKSPNG
ncbi:MAG: PilZ domain-containing protein [Nitrospiria bacterium]